MVKTTNYPVEFPPPNGFIRGKESKLDIRAEYRKGGVILTLPIECKKNNPEFVNWVFFPHYKWGMVDSHPFVSLITNVPRQPPAIGWDVTPSISEGFIINAKSVDEARETKGNYLDYKANGRNKDQLTRTSNAAITDACLQVAIATRAISIEDVSHSKALGSKNPPVSLPYTAQIILPVNVTTAKILICEFDINDVKPDTGEIPFNKATITEYPHLLFEYALPRFLQSAPQDLTSVLEQGILERFMRMDILVINSMHFTETLNMLTSMIR